MYRAVYVPDISERTVNIIDIDVQFGNLPYMKQAIRVAGLENVLEVSSKSDVPLGKQLSAFSLKAFSPSGRRSTVERFYQGSKVFEKGGPYQDIYWGNGNPKSDKRIKSSGKVIGYQYGDRKFPLNPNGAFYNWLYVNALKRVPNALSQLREYNGFTDLFYDPRKGFNCQAFSCALFVATDGLKGISIRDALAKMDTSNLFG